MGDSIHQRALIRQWLEQDFEVWLETSWPSIYHDFTRLHFLKRDVALRCQAKNRDRERAAFDRRRPPAGTRMVRIEYQPNDVRNLGSVMRAMLKCVDLDTERTDFRLPIPTVWREQAQSLLRSVSIRGRPLLIYRPLSERSEWGGNAPRNPLPGDYAQIFAAIRRDYYVLSVADIEPPWEWQVSEPIQADAEFCSGEIPFETLAGLFSVAALIYTAPGFAVPLAQAVGTPVLYVCGGYESSRSFSAGFDYAPSLGIDPIQPCECFSHYHACRKVIDLTKAIPRAIDFAQQAVERRAA